MLMAGTVLMAGMRRGEQGHVPGAAACHQARGGHHRGVQLQLGDHVVDLGRRPQRGRDPNPTALADGCHQQTDPHAGDDEPADDAEVLLCLGRRERCGRADREAEQQHAGGMGDRDGRADGDDVAQPPAPADEIGGHDRLAVPRQEGVPRTEQHRQQHGEQADPDGEVLAADDVVEGRGEPVQLAHEDAGDRQVLGDAVGGRAGAGLGRDRAAAHIQRRAEQVVGVAAQLVADAPGREGRALQRDAGRDRGDLMPADAVAVPGAVDPHGRLVRQVDPPGQVALEAPDGQLNHARSLGVAAALDGHRHPVAADHDRQRARHRAALRPGVRRALGAREATVAARVDRGLALQGRQLGDVLDRRVGEVVVEQMQAVVVVDSEVAERVGGRGGRQSDTERSDCCGQQER